MIYLSILFSGAAMGLKLRAMYLSLGEDKYNALLKVTTPNYQRNI